ncbi:MAG: SOS response-associated peptidase [Spirochaetaceae bacterium]
MCFNATIMTPLEVAQYEYNLNIGSDFIYNGYSEFKSAFVHPFLPIILEDRVLGQGKWGLIPHWVKECKKSEEIVKYTLNARVETLEEKPSFRGSVNGGRIIVLMDGFYEWKHIEGKKIPHYVSDKSGKPLLIGGLVSAWGGINTFSIITTEAQGVMREVHNSKLRMPLIIKKEEIDYWLDSKISYRDVKQNINPQYENYMAIEKEPVY